MGISYPLILMSCRRFKPIGIFTGVSENSRDCYETLKVEQLYLLTIYNF